MPALAGCPQDPVVHPEGDVFIHTGLVLDEARKLIDDLPRPKQLAVMLGALCHDLGKPATTEIEEPFSSTKSHEKNTKGITGSSEVLRETSCDFVEGNKKISAKEHEAASVALTEKFLDRLKLFTFDGYDVRKQTLALVKHHAVPHRWGRAHKAVETITDGMFRRLALEVEPDLLYRVARADCLGRTGDFKPEFEEWFLVRVRELGIEQQAPAALLLGRHVLALGLPPGPRIGEIARAVYERQLDGEVLTLDEAIAAARAAIEQHA
ncbi:MAG TPA: HD domain-containing protein [Blastocatellia bacterium]|nr:HD domain-containing protein [Blastocatellia bacterium]